MKKLILLAFLAIMVAGCDIEIENPLAYDGAVITGKDKTLGVFSFQLLLPCSQEDSIRKKYIWIEVTQLDYTKYNLGDTIKSIN